MSENIGPERNPDVTNDLTDPSEVALVSRADRLAVTAHAGQIDKAGRPYIEHVHRVAAAMPVGWHRAVALLHDVVEDTKYQEADLIAAGMPRDVVDAVLALTHRPGEPRADYYRRVREGGAVAVAVKRADIADNSSPARLAALDEPTRTRLIDKYTVALAALDDAG